MKIEIYADVVCPWCYIGETRFAQALRSFEHAEDVDVCFRPFQLDNEAPSGMPLRTYLSRRYGTRARAMMQSAQDAAHAEGIVMHFGHAVSANTADAHRLLMLALEEYGSLVQRALAASLFAAHFQHGDNIADHDVLVRLAGRAGVSEKRARTHLESDDGVDALRLAMRRAAELGVAAAPTFVIDDRFAVEGAQPASTMLHVLNDVVAESV